MHLFKGNIVLDALNNLFHNTHIARDNYFYYGYFFGAYSPECCPRYLQPQHFASLKASVGRIDIQTGTLQDVASRYADGFFSRYILLDHMDCAWCRKGRKGPCPHLVLLPCLPPPQGCPCRWSSTSGPSS